MLADVDFVVCCKISTVKHNKVQHKCAKVRSITRNELRNKKVRKFGKS